MISWEGLQYEPTKPALESVPQTHEESTILRERLCQVLGRTHALRGAVKVFYSFAGLIRQVLQQWCATAFERLEIDGFIVRCAILPTPIQDANPFEGQGPHGSLMCLALITLLLVIDLCPEGMSGGFSRPLHKRLAQKLGTLETPVDPGLLAAAFRHWRNTRIFLEFVGGGKAFPLFAEGDEGAGSKNGPSPWQGVKQREVRMVLGW